MYRMYRRIALSIIVALAVFTFFEGCDSGQSTFKLASATENVDRINDNPDTDDNGDGNGNDTGNGNEPEPEPEPDNEPEPEPDTDIGLVINRG